MIYFHCGLPKTGTSSLQGALVRFEDKLADVGILYPREWRRSVDGSHNDLDGVLTASRGSRAPVAEFRRILDQHAARDVLISSESLFLWLEPDARRELLLRLFAAAEEVAPVRCIWTLRRFDDVICSWYRQLKLLGIEVRPADQFLSRIKPNPAGFQHVEEVVTEARYVKYDSAGGHTVALLHQLGIPPDLATVIESDIQTNSRRLVSLTHKQAVAVLCAEELSARSGLELERSALLDVFRQAGFRFDEDRPWQPADDSIRLSLHREMLGSSLQVGFAPYPRFFGEEIFGNAFATPLSPDVLSDQDLDRLMDHIRQPSRA